MSGADKRRDIRTDSGFSMVESVTAVFILALGVLAMTATTTFITGRVSLAEVSTERLVAIQSAMERIRATPYDSISPGADTVGLIVIRWRVVSTNSDTKILEILAVGPGPRPASDSQPIRVMSNLVVDTFAYAVLEP